ncbi:hypothetical protein [Azorhizobium doebereinerae]|uniref:hypothetical protein n=1 Tax=Azorhizobium doebereinerae TaxID=281091 RepID=UPI0003FF0C10|nr:hypothetical protein [Azorhizobium doebereinerae]
MRTITTAALALAAAVTFSGIASADEYITAKNKEFYAVAAESAAESHAAAPLGYTQPASPRAAQVNAIFAPQTRSADSLQLQLGDRGIGTN